MPSGPPPSTRRRALRRAAASQGQAALAAVVRRSDDKRIERTVGSPAGLRVLFGLLAAAIERDAAQDVTAVLLYELGTARGGVRPWTVEVAPGRARARPGRAAAPGLTVSLSVADLARIAAGQLDPGDALLTGRMDLAGDFALATRLGTLLG